MGTGTSAGIPTIGCKCRVCLSDDPRDTRLRTGAALRFTDRRGRARTILLDATPDLRQQALRHDLDRCDAVLFTHNHVDHIFGLDEVRRFNVTMQAPIDVYAETHTLESLRRVYQHIFDAQANVNRSFVATLIAHTIEPLEELELFGLRVTPIRLLHGRLPILGFRFDAIDDSAASPILPLAYCTDVSGMPPETLRALAGVRTLVLDALRIRHHPTHYNLDQAVEVAQHVDAEQTYFVHMTHEIMHGEVDPELPEGVSLAFDGLVLGDVEAEAREAGAGAFADDATKDDDFDGKAAMAQRGG